MDDYSAMAYRVLAMAYSLKADLTKDVSEMESELVPLVVVFCLAVFCWCRVCLALVLRFSQWEWFSRDCRSVFRFDHDIKKRESP